MADKNKHIDDWMVQKISEFEREVTTQDWSDFEDIYFKKKSKRRLWLWFMPVFGVAIFWVMQGSHHSTSPTDLNKQKALGINASDGINKSSSLARFNDSSYSKAIASMSHESELLNITNHVDKDGYRTEKNGNEPERKSASNPPSINNSVVMQKFLEPSILNVEENNHSSFKDVLNAMTFAQTDSNMIKHAELDKTDSLIPKIVVIEKKREPKIKGHLPQIFMQMKWSNSLANRMTVGVNSTDLMLSKSRFADQNYQFEFGCYLNRYISLSSGIGQFNTIYKSSREERYASKITVSHSSVTNLNIDTASKKLTKVTHHIIQTDSVFSLQENKGLVKSSYISLPFAIGLHLPHKKMEFQWNLGFKYYLKSSLDVTGNSIPAILVVAPSFHAIHSSFELGYHLTPSLIFYFGTSVDYFNRAKSGAFIQNKVSYNFQSSIKYIFNK